MDNGRQRTHTKYLVREENDYFVIELPDEESPADEPTFSEKGDVTPVIESKHDPYEPSYADDEVDKVSFAEGSADGDQLVTCWDGLPTTRLCETRCARSVALLVATCVAVADSVTDLLVTVRWLALGEITFFWVSATVIVASGLVAVAVSRASRGKLGAPCFLWQILMATFAELRGIWSHERVELLSTCIVGQVISASAPQVLLQSYALVANWSKLGRADATLAIVSLACGLATVAGGATATYFAWEGWAAKVSVFAFLLAMVLARCGAFAVAFAELGVHALAFPVAGLAIRGALLARFKVVNPAEPLAAPRDESDSTLLRILGVAAATTASLHTRLLDLICITPFAALVYVVPFGARVDDPALFVDGHRYEGLKHVFSWSGAAVNTFRNRLASDLGVANILAHATENLAMLLAAAILSVMRPSLGTTDTLDTFAFCQFCFGPLVLALFLYFAANALVNFRELGWKRDLRAARCFELSASSYAGGFRLRGRNLLVEEMNRADSVWNSVLVKQFRPGSPPVLVHIPDLLLFCNQQYSSPEFGSFDELMTDIDHNVWKPATSLVKFKRLGLRGLALGKIDESDLDDIKYIVHAAIADDHVRPMLRVALDNLAVQLRNCRNALKK